MSRVRPAPAVRDVLKVIEESGELPVRVGPDWRSQELERSVVPDLTSAPLVDEGTIVAPLPAPELVLPPPPSEPPRLVHVSAQGPVSPPAPDHLVEVRNASAGVAADLLAGALAAAQQIVEKAAAERDGILAAARADAEVIIARAQAEATAYLAERLHQIAELADGLTALAREQLDRSPRP